MLELTPRSAPLGNSALEPSRKPEQMPRMSLLGSAAESLAHAGDDVGPAEVGEARDQRGAGDVVEQEVQGRAGLDLFGQFLGDGRAQVAPGAGADQALQRLVGRVAFDAHDVSLSTGGDGELGLVEDRGLPADGSEQVAGWPLRCSS